MAGDQFKKPRSGDPLVISADAYGTFLDMAQAFRGGMLGNSVPAGQPVFDSGTVKVRNDSSKTARWSVCGLGNPLFDPDSKPAAFQQAPVLLAVDPVDDCKGNLCVFLEPIAQGKIGPARVSGRCLVQLDNRDDDDGHERLWMRYADVHDESVLLMPCGSLKVLWCQQEKSAEAWAVVCAGPIGGQSWYRGTLQEALSAGGSAACEIQVYGTETADVEAHDRYLGTGSLTSGTAVSVEYDFYGNKFYVTETSC